MDAARAERLRALARERMRRRRADPAVRAKESAARRERREANPELRKKATEAKRRQRQANPELVRKEAEARRLRRLANPKPREKVAQVKRQLRKGNAELRNKGTQAKRAWRQESEQRGKRTELPLTEGAGGRFERVDLKCSRLLEDSTAAEHAISITWASHLAGKGNSLTQCRLPAVSKSLQADFKRKLRSVGVQAQHGSEIPASLVRRKSAATGTSAVCHSHPEAADIALRMWEELHSKHSTFAS